MTKRLHPVLAAQRREEAELLRQCSKLAEVSIQIMALWRQRTTIEVELRTDAEMWALQDRQAKIQRRIRSLRPATDEGWVALARACMLDTYAADDEIVCNEDAQRIAWTVVAKVAGLPPLAR